jgi:7-carboxy-7-deazaguanine synthase
MDSLAVNEIFYSIQGEASRTGQPCVFVRTQACQMRCSYCDTAYAFYEGRSMHVDEILQKIREFPCKLVEITGGEPLLQKQAVSQLMTHLLGIGYTVLLETGGGVSLDGVPDSCIKIVDVKCPDSGELNRMNWSFLEKTYPNTELKFVLSSAKDYFWVKNFIRENARQIAPYTLWMSPVRDKLAPAWLAQQILHDALPVRLQLQLHKVIWGDVPGV